MMVRKGGSVVKALDSEKVFAAFSDAELSAIITHSRTNGDTAATLERFRMGGMIRRDDKKWKNRIEAFESAGLIAVGRAAQVMRGKRG